MKNEQDDWFDDLPPRKTLKEFFAQVGPPAGPPPAYLRPKPAGRVPPGTRPRLCAVWGLGPELIRAGMRR